MKSWSIVALSVLFGDALGVPLVALEANGAVPAARGALPLETAALGPALGAPVFAWAALKQKEKASGDIQVGGRDGETA